MVPLALLEVAETAREVVGVTLEVVVDIADVPVPPAPPAAVVNEVGLGGVGPPPGR